MSGEICYRHVESKLGYPYNCAAVLDALHVPKRTVQAQPSQSTAAPEPAPILFTSKDTTKHANTCNMSLSFRKTAATSFYERPKRDGHSPHRTKLLLTPRMTSDLRCINSDITTIRVASYPFPKNRANIEINLDTWRATRGVSRPSSIIHAVYIAHVDLSAPEEGAVLLEPGALTEEEGSSDNMFTNTRNAKQGL